MIRIFHTLREKAKLKREAKEGKIDKTFDTGFDEILALCEEYKNKSIKDDTFYVMGTDYIKGLIDLGASPEIIQDVFIKRSLHIDESPRRIPLSLGIQLEQWVNDPTTLLGVHRSYAVKGEVFEDPILHNIMEKGLINNGAAMQGIVSIGPPDPGQTISPANDLMRVAGFIKSSFRGSEGSILLALPKELVSSDLCLKRGVDPSTFYNIVDGVYFVKPEFLLGYVHWEGDQCIFYSREELLAHYKGKEL